MRFKKSILLAFAALTASPAVAGGEFGIWTSLGAEKDLTDRISLDANFDFRTQGNLEGAGRWAGGLGLGFKANSWLKLGGGYVYIYDYMPQESEVNITNSGKVNGYNVDHGYWRSKHRFYVEGTGSLKAGRFKFSLRERYQYTYFMPDDVKRTRYRDEVQGGFTGETYPWNGQEFMEMTVGEKHKSGKNKHVLRSRLKVEYNIPRCPFNPYATYELTNSLTDALDLDKMRVTVGTEWKITKKHVVTMGYLFERGHDEGPDATNHVLDLSYKFKF